MPKTLLQTLLAAFCAILAHTSLEGGGVMLIGMRNAMLSGGKFSAKSYVQDGLVAMWDGEWNAGWGVHDAAATVWKDLSGNGYDLTAPTNYAWGANCCDIAAGNRFSGTAEIFTAATTEFVGCFTGSYVSTTTNDMGVELGGRGIGSAFLMNIVNSNNDVVVLCRASVSGGIANYRKIGPYPADARTRYLFPTAFSCYGYVDPTNYFREARVTVNGVTRNAAASVYWTSGESTPTDSVLVGTAGRTSIRLFCTRLYSRALTAAELAANYAVDKARFNLPDAT